MRHALLKRLENLCPSKPRNDTITRPPPIPSAEMPVVAEAAQTGPSVGSTYRYAFKVQGLDCADVVTGAVRVTNWA